MPTILATHNCYRYDRCHAVWDHFPAKMHMKVHDDKDYMVQTMK